MRLWAIWHAKREAIHENMFQSPLSTHCFVERFVAELELVKPVGNVRQMGKVTVPKWIPPPQGVTKINVDAATSKNSNISAAVAMACDGGGNFLGASALVLKGIVDAETVEVIACREGLALASDPSLQNLRVASDCANVEINSRRRCFRRVEFIHEGNG
uniref:RNase H type-1 domain-containing protein n=1 Tax=Setaria viridis TaxID=4556 RepID=A0A4U6V7L2_SETVI|nr:hypothetical protein SEVIR_4G049000v2 [Setaria viridis]